jgi:hypothetical protein
MTKYEMMMAAAEAITTHPGRYDFSQAGVVDNDVDPRCILGEMWWQAGIVYRGSVGMAVPMILGMTESEFFSEIQVAYGKVFNLHNATQVPTALRKLAKKYEGIPEDVRAIFDAKRYAGIPDDVRAQFVTV